MEKPEDHATVRIVNEQAFGQPLEANIVETLRWDCSEALSLVADETGEVIGHIMFTPATIENQSGKMKGMGLAPMAVLPARQRQGIGSKLVKQGLRILQDRGCPFVIVLGHPEYYPRFGFEMASKYGVTSQWEGIPDDAFMILIIDKSILPNLSGVARYRDEFNDAI